MASTADHIKKTRAARRPSDQRSPDLSFGLPKHRSINWFRNENQRLRSERDRQRERRKELELTMASKEDELNVKQQTIDDLQAKLMKAGHKPSVQTSLIMTELQELKTKFEGLKERKEQKDKQLSNCIHDLDKEKKAREEAIKLLANTDADKQRLIVLLNEAKADAQRNQTERTKLAQRLDKARKELIATRMANTTTHPTNQQLVNKLAVCQEMYESMSRQNTLLKETNSRMTLQMEQMQKSFHTQVLALKNQRKYFQASAESNKRKRALAEYLIGKKRQIENKKMKKIAEDEQICTKLVFDSLKKTISVVLNEHMRTLNANNSEKLVQIAKQSAQEENAAIDKSRTILEKNADGKCEYRLV